MLRTAGGRRKRVVAGVNVKHADLLTFAPATWCGSKSWA